MTEFPPGRTERGDYLRQRNALWQRLRSLEPQDPQFEAVTAELAALTHQTRAQILAGLGLDPAQSPP